MTIPFSMLPHQVQQAAFRAVMREWFCPTCAMPNAMVLTNCGACGHHYETNYRQSFVIRVDDGRQHTRNLKDISHA
jgi:hypothetical protein